jgi:hypothetical protein
MHTKFYSENFTGRNHSENLTERDCLENLGVDGKIT